MAFSRTLLGWAVVTALLLLWREVERRVQGTPGSFGASLRHNLAAPVVEALLLTLFAGLWFGSLGSGGAWLLFLLVGGLMEIPARLRAPAGLTASWAVVALRVARTVIAGILLGLVMG